MEQSRETTARTPTIQLREALRLTDERLELILRGSNDGFWDWNVATDELYLAPRWLEMLGYAPDELEPHIRTLENVCHPEELPSLREAFRAQLEGTASHAMEIEHRVRTKSGDWKWFLTRGTVGKRDERGKASRLAGTATDITARKHAEEELREHHDLLDEMVAQRTLELAEANAELEFDIAKRKQVEKKLQDSNAMLTEALEREKSTSTQLKAAIEEAEAGNRAKSDFLANMSHEIRTPMTAILGFAENLLDADLPASEKLSCVHTIRRNGEYLLDLINDILDLSKIEAGKMTIERGECQPCRLVAEVASLMRVRADAKGLSFSVEYIGAIPETIQSDVTRLRQILINLIGNAIKFTEIGAVRLVTSLLNHGGEPYLQFDVIDSGRGIAQKKVSSLFQTFMQADTSTTREFGGTGLGLTISKRFAKLLGGDVSIVETEMGVGSTFRATVATRPLDGVKMLDDPLSATVVSDASAPVAQNARSDLQGVRILLAEDGPDNQRLISFMLKKAGAEMTVKENGKLALDAALAAREEGNPFEVILMDMQMPVMDGYEATGQLRKKGLSLPIIALTAHAMDSDRQKCIDAGCDDYATKPIDRAKLIALIGTHIASR